MGHYSAWLVQAAQGCVGPWDTAGTHHPVPVPGSPSWHCPCAWALCTATGQPPQPGPIPAEDTLKSLREHGEKPRALPHPCVPPAHTEPSSSSKSPKGFQNLNLPLLLLKWTKSRTVALGVKRHMKINLPPGALHASPTWGSVAPFHVYFTHPLVVTCSTPWLQRCRESKF